MQEYSEGARAGGGIVQYTQEDVRNCYFVVLTNQIKHRYFVLQSFESLVLNARLFLLWWKVTNRKCISPVGNLF